MAKVILVNQTTNGGEYLISTTGADYVGIFHVYDDGTIRTGFGLLNSTQTAGNLLTPNPVAQGLPQYVNPSTAPTAFSGGVNTVDIDLTPDGQSLIFEEDKLSKDGYKKHATAVHQARYDNEVYTEVIDTTISELLNIRPTPPLEILQQPAQILNTGQLRLIQASNLQFCIQIKGKSILNPPLRFDWYQDGEPIIPLAASNRYGQSIYEITTLNGAKEYIKVNEIPTGISPSMLNNMITTSLENDLGYTAQMAFNYAKSARLLFTENKLTIYNLKEPESGFWNCQITDSQGNIVISEGVFLDVVNQFDMTIFNGNIVKNGDGRQDNAFWTKTGDAPPIALAMKDESGPYYFGSQFKGDNSISMDGRYYPPSDFWDNVNPGTRGQPVTKDQRYFLGGWTNHAGGVDDYTTYPLNNYTSMRQEIDLTEAIEIIDREIVGVEDVRMDVWSWLGSMGWTNSVDARYSKFAKYKVANSSPETYYVGLTWNKGWGTGPAKWESPLLTGKFASEINNPARQDTFARYVENAVGLRDLMYDINGSSNLSQTSDINGFVYYDYHNSIFSDWVRGQVHDKVYVTFEFYGGEEEKLNTAGSGDLGQHVLENPYYYEELPHALYYYVVRQSGWYSNSSYRGETEGSNLKKGGWMNICGTSPTDASWQVGGVKYNQGAYLDSRVGLSDNSPDHPNNGTHFKYTFYDNAVSGDWGSVKGNAAGNYGGSADNNYDGFHTSGLSAGPRSWLPSGDGYKPDGSTYKPFDFVYAAGGGDSTLGAFPLFSDRFAYGMIAFNGIRFNRIYKKTKFYFVEKPNLKVPKGTRKVVVTVRFERDKIRGWDYSRLGYQHNFNNRNPRENGSYGLMIWTAATNINAHLKVKLKDDLNPSPVSNPNINIPAIKAIEQLDMFMGNYGPL